MPYDLAVAVSGGQDSLMALALLREAGHAVVALHGLFQPEGEGQARTTEDLAVQCGRLGVELHVLDLRAEFEALVVAPFAQAYARGLTPNPCAWCNARIKLGLILDQARALGAGRLATGHYARLAPGEGDGPAGLMRGLDPAKDQSYFLSLVGAERLACCLFPLGETRKSELPAMLAARGLTPPLPSESQDVCFIPADAAGGYRFFLEARSMELPGPGPVLLREDGRERVVGAHQGLWRHTIGQRRGLNIAHAEPLYVLGKDSATNTLVVGPVRELRSFGLVAREVNVLVAPTRWPAEVLVQARHRQHPVRARASLAGDTLTLSYLEPGEPPASGQVAALFDASGRVLAGAIITESLSSPS